ncbi:hypothetical protein BB560_005516, partial [Smittium megazygosporum]
DTLSRSVEKSITEVAFIFEAYPHGKSQKKIVRLVVGTTLSNIQKCVVKAKTAKLFASTR